MSDFVKTKVDPLIVENDELQSEVQKRKDSYNQGLKFFYGVPTYWRGMKSKSGVKSISADAAVYDEFDEVDQAQVAQARKRLSASEVKLERELSTPTIPDYGINKQFQTSDQCHYAFHCSSCGRWNILEDYFPECFQQDKSGNYYHACRKCKNRLDVTKGRWVQKESGNVIRGYQISQLYSPFVSPNEIMHEYLNTEFIGHFYNHVLGIPYLSATDRVTAEMVLSLCDPMREMKSNYLPQTAMGIDVGSLLHIVIIDPKKPTKLIWVGELKNFEELDLLMLKFNTKTCVIDALPETRKVKEFTKRQVNKAWACFYNDNMKGNYAWDEEQKIVSVNRTESLDASTLSIFRKELSLPQRNPMLERFADHCQNIAKVVEEDREKGDRKYVYRKIGPDHFRHAYNYAMIAASKMRGSGIASVFR